MQTTPIVSALTIAGSDSGGGAGIQADLKTFAAHRVHGLSAIAALTAQHTRGVTAVHVPDVGFLRAQIDACFDDFTIGAVKIGMLASAEVIDCVADALEAWPQRSMQSAPGMARVGESEPDAQPEPLHRSGAMPNRIAIVLDPVMVATSGAKLLEDDALDALKLRLLPLASIITPNIPEAELLTGMQISTADHAQTAIDTLHAMGASTVLLKGGHLDEGERVIDRFDDGSTRLQIIHPRLQLDGHGTGCTLASAIAANLCLGLAMPQAVQAATDYIGRALQGGYRPGRGDVVVLDHFGAAR
ncbi:MAG: PfkB family carbohydrate kinase [Thermomonas sp.]|uniref:PfkB family carbohydrate kinase n=1 Tax=Thermomonas sp. TaxID=1971895 RepID=UPI0039E2E96D